MRGFLPLDKYAGYKKMQQYLAEAYDQNAFGGSSGRPMKDAQCRPFVEIDGRWNQRTQAVDLIVPQPRGEYCDPSPQHLLSQASACLSTKTTESSSDEEEAIED
jgi:hypothetical protein